MHRLRGTIVLMLLAAACASGKTRRVDIADDDEIMGTGIESADVEAMSKLAQSLIRAPDLTGAHVEGIPTVAIHPVQNDTSYPLDGALFVRRIRAELVRQANGRVRFVTRTNADEALIERERTQKREGERTSSKQVVKTGADFYLTGTAASISKVARKRNSDAFWIDFRLIDAENGEIVWEDTYKTKKVGQTGVIYR